MAYLVALAVTQDGKPVLAPLTALLVVQVSLSGTLVAGVQRVASVVAGVLTAVLFSEVVGFTWWSLGIVIAVTLLIGQLLRLGDQLLEVPISAMLVLAVGGADTPAVHRITETLVGAGVGVLYNLALPGPATARPAGEAVREFAADVAKLLRSMATESMQGPSTDNALGWLEGARRLDRDVAAVDRAIVRAQESRQFNVRALGTKNTVPSLRSALDALEHATVAIRSLCRAVVEDLQGRPEGARPHSSVARELFAQVLNHLADAFVAFGNLVREEADAADQPADEELATALLAVRETRVRLSELLLEEARNDRGLWELHGALLTSLERIGQEIDPAERSRQRERRRREWAARRPAVHAVERIRTTSRQVAQRPIRRRTGAGATAQPARPRRRRPNR